MMFEFYLSRQNAKPAEIPALPTTYKLIYRGMTYLVNRTAQGEVTVVTQPASTLKVETLSISQKFKLQQ